MFADYFSILLFLIMAVGMGVALILSGGMLGPRTPSDEKMPPSARGFGPFGGARLSCDVRSYLSAILFIIFDRAAACMLPCGVARHAVGLPGLLAMAVFLLILVVGFIYEWKKGALEWE